MTIKIECLCGRSVAYDACCGVYHAGLAATHSAEALMRSRYSAYVLNNSEYIANTWHLSTRPAVIEADLAIKWLGLRIIDTAQPDDAYAEVEFIAKYKLAGKAYRLHERSCFVFEQNSWWYVDGKINH